MVLLIVLVGNVMDIGNDDYILLAEGPNICNKCYEETQSENYSIQEEGSCVSQGKWNEQLQVCINLKKLV